jgi:protein-disulfide isomerase
VSKTVVKVPAAPVRGPRQALALGLLVVAALAVAGLIWLLSRTTGAAVEVLDLSGTVEMGLTADGRPYRGSLQAPVVVRSYEDPLCVQCYRFFTQTEQLVLENYIKTGQVRQEAYFLPILGAESLPAAEAAECAAELGKFWEYRQLLYLNLPLNEHDTRRETLLTYARVAGLDTTAFTSCLDGGRHQIKLQRLTDEALDAGLDAAPIFVIAGRVVPGARPYIGDEQGPGFKEFLDSALAEAGAP